MPQLSEQHKSFIVMQLACYEQPSEIMDRIKEKFGITVSRQQVCYYNPGNKQGGRELARKWRHLFNETRDNFIEGLIDIPIAHKMYRLRELQKNYDKMIRGGNLSDACHLLEQAAEEVGGAFQSKTHNQTGEKACNFYQQVSQRILKLKESS